MSEAGSLARRPAFDWREAPARWRDRLLASPGFRRWATAFPLTRPVARRRARALFDLCAGFVYAQVLQACVRLDLFAILAEGPQSVAALAHRTALPVDAAERLLAAACSLKLVRRRGARFGIGPLGAAMIGNPGIAAMVEHHAVLYADLQDPVALLRGNAPGTGLGRYWAYARAAQPETLEGSQIADYTALMAASQPLIADEVLQAYRLERHRVLLDVGGGDGSFIACAAARLPCLQFMLFDLPPVAERAARRFAFSGLANRATAAGGDFRVDALPAGADVATLIRVVHDHDDDSARAILSAVHRALPPGGTLLLAEPMAGTPGAEPIGDAYFGFYLLAMGSGRARTPTEFQEMLMQAGFSRNRLVPTRMPMLTRLIVALKD